MHYLVRTLSTADENLALDEALLLEADAGRGGDVLRIWHTESLAVVLGAGGSVALDVVEAACRADGVPVLRRSSGGGSVLLGPGCLCFSLVLSYQFHPALSEIGSSYGFILGRMCEILRPIQQGLERAGTSDLAVGGRKCSGNAQQRKRGHLLHHGTLLFDFDLARVGAYLRMPERRPEYRAGRAHQDFLMNLPATAEEIAKHLRAGWGAEEAHSDWPEEDVRRLVAEKYSRHEWVRRR
jgi:lipoate-protein ligase A